MADFWRAAKESAKKTKTFVMTAEEVEKLRRQEFAKAREQLLEKNAEMANDIFRMMLAIPTNVLIADYWPKSAKKKIPEFVEKCMSLFDAWSGHDVVKMQQMIELTEQYAGIKLVEDKSITRTIVNSEKYTH